MGRGKGRRKVSWGVDSAAAGDFAAAARYASVLRNLLLEEREALRQGLYDWDRGDALLGDEDLDAMLLDLREAMEDLSLQARRIAELGDDLMLLLLA